MNTEENRYWEFECVVQSIRRAARLLSRRYEEALRPVNLTSSQFSILQALRNRNGLPQGTMAEILGFEPTTLTRILRPLEKRKLIKVVPTPNDQRRRMVSITKEGDALFVEAKHLWQREHDESLSRMDPVDWKSMKQVLGELSR